VAKAASDFGDKPGDPKAEAKLDDIRREARRKSLIYPLAWIATDFRNRIRAGLRTRAHTVQPAQSAVITHLKIEGMGLTELAERAGMTKQGMGKRIDELEAEGYVVRSSNPEDGRAKLIQFSEKGLALLEDCGQIVDEIWNEYANIIGEDHLQQFRQYAEKLQQELMSALAADK